MIAIAFDERTAINLIDATQMVAIRIIDFIFIKQKFLLNLLQGHFMTLHFVVTLKLKTVIKKSNWQLRRSGAGSYPAVTLLPLQLRLNLNVSSSSGSSSGKDGLLRGSGSNTLVIIVLLVKLQKKIARVFQPLAIYSDQAKFYDQHRGDRFASAYSNQGCGSAYFPTASASASTSIASASASTASASTTFTKIYHNIFS